jgi:phosphohistidine phosphatase
MKTLFLVRHAKSSWDDTALRDKDRPLNDRGKRDAAKMGERLAKIDVKPDLILSSPARRALTTAQIVAKKLDYKLKNILVDNRLYAVGGDDLLDVIRKLGDKSKRVMLFGHNPELTELAHRLSSKITRMPTCAVAEFTFDAKSWANTGEDKPTKVTLETLGQQNPRALTSGPRRFRTRPSAIDPDLTFDLLRSGR